MKLTPGSKWSKHRIAAQSPELRRYLPETMLYSKAALTKLLDRHDVVFVKPVYGGGGYRIFRVQKQGEQFEVKLEHQKRVLRSLEAVHAWIESVRKGNRFLVQQGIELAVRRGRPVDIRTIVQKMESGSWEVTRLFAKTAGRNLAVTNMVIGGTASTVREYLLGIGYSAKRATAAIRLLKAMSLQIARQYGRGYANAIFGLDIGLDRSGKFWLIEVNTAPQLSIFRAGKLTSAEQRSLKLWKLHESVNRAAEKHRGSWRRSK
ncbi:YheC/D-like protein [Tumebacillus sp. BK434]|uniref:YheC/YheD family protein n=1 Tax=Tumebacillus sp. BK434 TaxID=2512169 RepID=UPI0010F39B2A|nr:YheC/YheD family protein [Tumebacillus sp. BK434]TCP52436.1 YheC/D-like protein [Tumebacillus sp. BK434]